MGLSRQRWYLAVIIVSPIMLITRLYYKRRLTASGYSAHLNHTALSGRSIERSSLPVKHGVREESQCPCVWTGSVWNLWHDLLITSLSISALVDYMPSYSAGPRRPLYLLSPDQTTRLLDLAYAGNRSQFTLPAHTQLQGLDIDSMNHGKHHVTLDHGMAVEDLLFWICLTSSSVQNNKRDSGQDV